jgi:hypothetical protein
MSCFSPWAKHPIHFLRTLLNLGKFMQQLAEFYFLICSRMNKCKQMTAGIIGYHPSRLWIADCVDTNSIDAPAIGTCSTLGWMGHYCQNFLRSLVLATSPWLDERRWPYRQRLANNTSSFWDLWKRPLAGLRVREILDNSELCTRLSIRLTVYSSFLWTIPITLHQTKLPTILSKLIPLQI